MIVVEKSKYEVLTELKVQEVFGQSRSIPLNYVERKTVDDLFLAKLLTNKHIVLYGSSKLGKSSMYRFNLEQDRYEVIHCSNNWDIGRLNAQILRHTGFELNTSTYKTIDGKTKVLASYKSSEQKVSQPKESLGREMEKFQSIELDPYDPNDIIDALKLTGFNKYIILEDFHYLQESTKENFCIQLKTFHETSSITFIIAGTWNDENKLEEFNPDLLGRLTSINVSKWSRDELLRVIIRGEKLLNISLNDETKAEILNWCNDDVFRLQEICLEFCLRNGIRYAQEITTDLGYNIEVADLKLS